MAHDPANIDGLEVWPEDLTGHAEVATYAGVPLQTVTCEWATSDDYPQPMLKLDIGPVYYWPVVRAWMERKGFTVVLPPAYSRGMSLLEAPSPRLAVCN